MRGGTGGHRRVLGHSGCWGMRHARVQEQCRDTEGAGWVLAGCSGWKGVQGQAAGRYRGAGREVRAAGRLQGNRGCRFNRGVGRGTWWCRAEGKPSRDVGEQGRRQEA